MNFCKKLSVNLRHFARQTKGRAEAVSFTRGRECKDIYQEASAR